MTAKDTRGPAAYDGTAALKMDAPAAPTKPRWRLPRRKPTEKIEKSAKREKPPAPPQAAGSGAAGWLARTGRWTVPGAILALVVVTLVIVVTLASYAQLVMVNDQVVELRDSLSQLQSEETQLAAQYELAIPWSWRSPTPWSTTRGRTCCSKSRPSSKGWPPRCGNISEGEPHTIRKKNRRV